MVANTFTLGHYFNQVLSYNEVLEATVCYKTALTNNSLIIPEVDTLELMLLAKRKKISFGPYQNLSFFEISNRIYSDLVLLDAAKILFEKHHIKSIQLKMSNRSGNDLIAIDKYNNEIIGEAFNTACSFFQVKMRSELKKFKDKKGIIAFNDSALSAKNRFYLNKKKIEYPNIVFIKCNNL